MTVQLLYYNQTTLNNYQVNIIIKLTRQFSNVSVQVSIGLYTIGLRICVCTANSYLFTNLVSSLHWVFPQYQRGNLWHDFVLLVGFCCYCKNRLIKLAFNHYLFAHYYTYIAADIPRQ